MLMLQLWTARSEKRNVINFKEKKRNPNSTFCDGQVPQKIAKRSSNQAWPSIMFALSVKVRVKKKKRHYCKYPSGEDGIKTVRVDHRWSLLFLLRKLRLRCSSFP